MSLGPFHWHFRPPAIAVCWCPCPLWSGPCCHPTRRPHSSRGCCVHRICGWGPVIGEKKEVKGQRGHCHSKSSQADPLLSCLISPSFKNQGNWSNFFNKPMTQKWVCTWARRVCMAKYETQASAMSEPRFKGTKYRRPFRGTIREMWIQTIRSY